VIVSDEVRLRAGLPDDILPSVEVPIRGRNESMVIRTVTEAATLATILDTAKADAA
jgi:adenylate cyclase